MSKEEVEREIKGMPKSKNKRKRGKQSKRKSSGARPQSTPKQHSTVAASSPDQPKGKRVRKPRRKLSLKQSLFENDGASLYRFALYFPLLIGAWCASGIVLAEVKVFALVTVSIALAHFFVSTKDRDDVPFVGNLVMLLHAGQVVVLIAAYHLTKHPGLILALGLTAFLAVVEQYLDRSKPFGVLSFALSNLIRASLYGVLGVLSQAYTKELGVYEIYAMYGFPAGCTIFAYITIKHLPVLLENEWTVQRTVTKKDGTSIQRPGPISQVYAFALMLGPAVCCAAIPFGIIPSSFLVLAFSFLVLPKLAEAQFNQSTPHAVLVLQTVMCAAGMGVLTLIAGILARYGIIV